MRRILAVILLVSAIACREIDLRCEWNPINWPRMIGKECLPKNLIVTSRNVTITSVNRRQKIHEDAKSLQIIEQTVKFLPSGIGHFMPKIEALWILYSKLEAIEETDLKQFPELRECVLRGNNIGTLSDDLFKSNQELVLVDFANNKITTIGENFIFPLTKLNKINLYGNLCIDNEAWTNKEMEILYEVVKSNCSEKVIAV